MSKKQNKKKTAIRRRKIKANIGNAKPMASARPDRASIFREDIMSYDKNVPPGTTLKVYFHEALGYRNPSGASAFLNWTRFFSSCDVYEFSHYIAVTPFAMEYAARAVRRLSVTWDNSPAPCSACGVIRGAADRSVLTDAEYLICQHGRRFYIEYRACSTECRTTELLLRGYGGVI